MKVAVFLPNWLGDVVMATPSLRALRRHFGSDARMVGIMRPYLRMVLEGTPWLSEQWYFDPRSKDAALGRWRLVRRLRRERFDWAVLLPNSLQSAALAWLGGAKRRAGYVRDGRGPLLTTRLKPPLGKGGWIAAPTVDYYLALAAAVGCEPESPRLELHTTPTDEQSADHVFAGLGLRSDGQVIALNSGGAFGATKWWPEASFASLARQIVDQLDHDVLIMCGPQERQLARQIARQSDRSRVFSMADQPLDLGTAKACIRRCRMMVSTDSGPRHVAAALGKPVVTLLGPTPPLWIANPTVHAVDVQMELPCIACRQKICPLGDARCMRDLPPEVVFDEVAYLLKSEKLMLAA